MGLTPPPPFEQCLKKLHNWFGMASLMTKIAWSYWKTKVRVEGKSYKILLYLTIWNPQSIPFHSQWTDLIWLLSTGIVKDFMKNRFHFIFSLCPTETNEARKHNFGKSWCFLPIILYRCQLVTINFFSAYLHCHWSSLIETGTNTFHARFVIASCLKTISLVKGRQSKPGPHCCQKCFF